MPADVDRLLRVIAPALVLLVGCDAKEPEPRVDTSLAASEDLGSGPVGVKTLEAPGLATVRTPPDVGVETPAVLELRLDLGTPDPPAPVDAEPPPEEPTPLEDVRPTPVARPKPPRRPRATCPSGTWCTNKKAAKKRAAPGTKFRQGCPVDITGFAGGGGAPSRSRLRGLDTAKTQQKRKRGREDACCYAWHKVCPGGRPLLDDAGAPVVASFEAGPPQGWSSGRERLGASTQARAFAAQAWLADAAMEHASVASFGRVALELLSLGAPPELIEGAHLAALDEIRHAKTCLSLARACGAEHVEPGRLASVPQRSAEFARFAADTFIEGCVGESIAALVVTRAAAGAEDLALRRSLEGIAADEARHAALAWRMVSWAIGRGGAPVLAAVLEAAERVREAKSGPASAGGEPDGIDRLGRLGATAVAQARRDGWTGIIDPLLTSLRGQAVEAS